MFVKSKNYKKFIFLIPLLGLLLFAFAFLYNKDKKQEEVLAQEEFVWQCGEEIPMGEAIDETIEMINSILNNADQMLNRGGLQIAEVDALREIPLPEACQASRCNTECVSGCAETDENGVCIRSTCDISPCTGQACPPELKGQLRNRVSEISRLYFLIRTNAQAIREEVEKREDIVEKLNEAREAFRNCATPASGYVAEEAVQLQETLFSCPEAKFFRILDTEEQEACYVGNYAPNFFCCRPVQR